MYIIIINILLSIWNLRILFFKFDFLDFKYSLAPKIEIFSLSVKLYLLLYKIF